MRLAYPSTCVPPFLPIRSRMLHMLTHSRFLPFPGNKARSIEDIDQSFPAKHGRCVADRAFHNDSPMAFARLIFWRLVLLDWSLGSYTYTWLSRSVVSWPHPTTPSAQGSNASGSTNLTFSLAFEAFATQIYTHPLLNDLTLGRARYIATGCGRC